MQELGEFSPSAATPGRPFLVAAGLVAAAVLGLLGLYQGFSLTWRQYPQLQGPSRSAAAPETVAAPVAVASEAAMEVPVADHHTADKADAAPEPTVQDAPPPDERATPPAAPIPANTADAAALTTAADAPAPSPSDQAPPLAPPSSPPPDLTPFPNPPPAPQ